MGRIYFDITDAINKQKFEVRIPESYNPNLPSYYTDLAMPPVFEPPEDHLCVSFMAPKAIIGMCFNDVSFEIVNPEDTIQIVDLIDQYLRASEILRASSEDLDNFCKRAERARNVLEPCIKGRRKFLEKRYGLRQRAANLMEAYWRLPR